MANKQQVDIETEMDSTSESLTEDLNNFKSSKQEDIEKKKEMQLVSVMEDVENNLEVKTNVSWLEMIENEHCYEIPEMFTKKVEINAEVPECSSATEIGGEKLFHALEKAAEASGASQMTEEGPSESEEIVEPTIGQLEIIEVESLIIDDSENPSELNANAITMTNEQHSYNMGRKNNNESMLFDGMQLKVKTNNRKKKNQTRATIKPPVALQIENDCRLARSVESEGPQTIYDFWIPTELVGPIIGKKGTYVEYILNKTSVELTVEKAHESSEDKFKICSLIGSERNIDKALKLIRNKFPKRRYRHLTLERVSLAPIVVIPTGISPLVKSELIEGINNHVIITTVVATDHFFVHSASSPDYESLASFNLTMDDTYSDIEDIPEVDLRTVTNGSVVAASSGGKWYRAQVIDVDEKKYESANVFFLDYGGCKNIEKCDMRTIHKSLISLSFQAIECRLANIAPSNGEWCSEAQKMFETLTNGQMLFAQVVYKSDGVQFINLLAFDSSVTVSINDELIKHGLAVEYATPSGIYRNEITPGIEN